MTWPHAARMASFSWLSPFPPRYGLSKGRGLVWWTNFLEGKTALVRLVLDVPGVPPTSLSSIYNFLALSFNLNVLWFETIAGSLCREFGQNSFRPPHQGASWFLARKW